MIGADAAAGDAALGRVRAHGELERALGGDVGLRRDPLLERLGLLAGFGRCRRPPRRGRSTPSAGTPCARPAASMIAGRCAGSSVGYAVERPAQTLRGLGVIAQGERVERDLLLAVRVVRLAEGFADAPAGRGRLRLVGDAGELAQQREAHHDHDGDAQPDGERGDGWAAAHCTRCNRPQAADLERFSAGSGAGRRTRASGSRGRARRRRSARAAACRRSPRASAGGSRRARASRSAGRRRRARRARA